MIKVSVLIVTYKREALLSKCLDSLLQLNAIFDLQLVLLINGDVASSELKKRLSTQFSNLTILEEKRLTPGQARNLALNHITGEWIFFIDDDAYIPSDYGKDVSQLLETHPEWECFGGPDSMPLDSNYFQESLALALASPFCTGPTYKRHYSHQAEIFSGSERDLTSCHLWAKKEVLDKYQIRFEESFHRGEETTFLQDLENKSVRLWVVPSLWLFHERRKNFLQLLRPLFYGGYYRSEILKNELGIFWLPSVMVLCHLIAFVSLSAFWFAACVYLCLAMMSSCVVCLRERKLINLPLVVILHYVIVTFYGTGFLYERLKRYFT